jgi:uncharacterized membrane protein
MSKFVVVVFPTEAKAYEGLRALRSLHAEGSLSVYAEAVLTKDAEGKVSVQHKAGPVERGMVLGSLIGALVGLLSGPGVALVALGGGAVAGGLYDVLQWGDATDFLDAVSWELMPGRSAVIAEVAEEWVTPLDSRMEALGGVVLRRQPTDLEAERIEKQVAVRRAKLAQLAAERAQAADEEMKARLKTRTDEAQTKLKETAERAKAAIGRLEEETEGKIAALQEQATTATADTTARIEERLAALRTDHDRRTTKLKQARELAREALTP